MNYKHGHSCNGKRTSIMNTWNDMMRRCYDVNNKRYERYGGNDSFLCLIMMMLQELSSRASLTNKKEPYKLRLLSKVLAASSAFY